MQRPEAIADASTYLWERPASELISIIGEGGFQSLYSRSIHLCSVAYPWMTLDHPLPLEIPQNTSRFAGLKISLEGRGDGSQRSQHYFIDYIYRHASLVNRRTPNGQHITFCLG